MFIVFLRSDGIAENYFAHKEHITSAYFIVLIV